MRSPTISATSCAQRDARSDQKTLVVIVPEGEADQDRCQGHQPWPRAASQLAEAAITRQKFQEILLNCCRTRRLSQHETDDVHASERTWPKYCAQMVGKIAQTGPWGHI
jgi:hypothetical protein